MPKKKNPGAEIERLLKDFSIKALKGELNKHRPKGREENAITVYMQIEATRKPGESVSAVCQRLERFGGIGCGQGGDREQHSGQYRNAEGLRNLTRSRRKPAATENRTANFSRRGLRYVAANPKVFPVGRSSFWKGVKDGKYPQPLKLGERATAWRATDVINTILR
jgi:hypothetical protein